MVDIAGKFGIKATLETSEVERGGNRIHAILDGVARKEKELNVFYDRSLQLLKDLTKVAVGFGLGIIGALTGAIAASPHFKVFLEELKGPWIDLTDYMGEEFSPLLTKISSKFGDFISIFTSNENVKDFFDKWVVKMGEFVDSISKEDMRKFIDWTTKWATKTLDFALEIGGNLWDILAGTDEKKGLIRQFLDLGETVTKTLKIDLMSPGAIDAISKALIAVAAWKMGGPILGLPVTAALLADVVGGLAGPITAERKEPSTIKDYMKDFAQAFYNYGQIAGQMMGLLSQEDVNRRVYAGFGTREGEEYYRNGVYYTPGQGKLGVNTGSEAYQKVQVVLIVEDRASGDRSYDSSGNWNIPLTHV